MKIVLLLTWGFAIACLSYTSAYCLKVVSTSTREQDHTVYSAFRGKFAVNTHIQIWTATDWLFPSLLALMFSMLISVNPKTAPLPIELSRATLVGSRTDLDRATEPIELVNWALVPSVTPLPTDNVVLWPWETLSCSVLPASGTVAETPAIVTVICALAGEIIEDSATTLIEAPTSFEALRYCMVADPSFGMWSLPFVPWSTIFFRILESVPLVSWNYFKG